MPRILPRGEIEGLDHTSIPRLRLPNPHSIFKERGQRLLHLATDHPAQTYLQLMAELSAAQHQALQTLSSPVIDEQHIAHALQHGMPPLLSSAWQRDPDWQKIMATLLQTLASSNTVPTAAQEIAAQLLHQLKHEPEAIEALADAVLTQQLARGDSGKAAFIMAALQVYWTHLASALSHEHIPLNTPFGVCPCCGSLPVSSIVRVGGSADGCRYLSCPRCSVEWHVVRVTCTHCESTDGIFYHGIEDGPAGIKAESCDSCHTYRKIFYQKDQLHVDPVADDLASLALDMLMGEAGYERSSGNPLLWQEP